MVVAAITVASSGAHAKPSNTHWTAVTPDEVVQQNTQAALRDDSDAMAHLALIYLMRDEATAGASRRAFERIGASRTTIARDAHWLGLQLLSEVPHPFTTAAAVRRDADINQSPVGLIRQWVIQGPYQDNGGGLAKKQGPETNGYRFVGADDSWGAYRVVPQRSVVNMVDARGLALDNYVHPRRESCSYLSAAVTLPAKPVQLHLACSGAFRIIIDQQTVAQDEATFTQALVDRATIKLAAQPGEHLVSIKVCSGPRHDDGLVRLHFSDAHNTGQPITVSSELARLDSVLARLTKAPASVQYTAATTPLQRTISLAASGSPARALAAAVVRTAFGSDDLRSQRAPGLLDSALKSSPSADQLALAGYVSTFSANRSARLMRAIAVAKQQNDADALAFAQRRLLLMRIDSGQTDLAYSMVHQMPLRDATDTHARWLKQTALSALGGRGLSIKATAKHIALANELGKKTPLVVWRSIIDSGSITTPQQYLRAQQALASAAPGARTHRYVQAFQSLGSAFMIRAAKSAVLHQRRSRDLNTLAHVLQQAGDYLSAREVIRLSAQLSPNQSQTFQQLADLEVLVAGPDGNSAATAALERAIQLSPDNPTLKAKLAFREGEQANRARAGEDAQYLVSPDVFLTRKKRRPAPAQGVHSRQLHWRRVVRYHPDHRVSQLFHYAREIVVPPRTQFQRYESVPAAMRGELLIARVHKRDGSVVLPEQKQDDGGGIRWPKLSRGDVVEVAVRHFTPGPVGRRGDPPFYFVDYVGSTTTEPVLYNEVVLDAPANSPLTWDVLGGRADEVKTHQNKGRTITRLIWHHPPTIFDEPWSPPASETLPLVVGSVYPSWDDFLQWYRGAVDGFTEPDGQVRRLAKELTANQPSREKKLEALFNFVADDIRYVNYVSGEWWLPNRPQQLLARRQGDCDDKAMLLISLLKAIDIDAQEVLVQTRLTAQPRVLGSTKAAIPMFDHGIIFLPHEDGKGGRFLDATSPQSRLSALPAMDAGAMALLVTPKDSRIVQVPSARAADHGVTARWSLTLASDGSGSVHATETHVGDSAFRLRRNLKQPDARAQWVEQNLIGGWLSALDVSQDVHFDVGSDGNQAHVEYRARAGSLARREGRDLIVSIAPTASLTATLAPLIQRTLPVQLPPWLAPTHRTITVSVTAPQGYRFAALPPNEALDSAFGSTSAHFSLAKDKRHATMRHQVSFSRARIEVAQYPAWRSFLQRSDRLSQRALRLTPEK